jgi:hypothetical protein
MFVGGLKTPGSECKVRLLQSLKKCDISNALHGSEDVILYEESDALNENCEDDFIDSDDDLLDWYDE